MSNPTARQIEYAQALGVPIPIGANRQQVSQAIDDAYTTFNGPPTDLQRQLATFFGIAIPESARTRRAYTDVLYEHIIARRWVYSVCRHAANASWRRYSESGIVESQVTEIACELVADPVLMNRLRDKEPGNSETGADVWNRVTSKSVNTPEYQYVWENLTIEPTYVVDAPPALSYSTSRHGRRRKKSSTGCLFHVLTLALCVFGLLYVFLK